MTVLAAWCGAWSVGRRLTTGRGWPRQLLGPQWLTINEAILSLGLLGMMILALAASAPGVAVELGFNDTLTADATHAFSYAGGSWLCLTLLLAALLAQLWNRLSTEGVVEFLVAVAAVPLLLAPHWEAANATASALRWAFAGYALVTATGCLDASVAGIRRPAGSLARLGPHSSALGSVAREAALLIGGVPIVLLTTIVASRRLAGLTVGVPDADGVFGQMGTTISYAVPLLVLVAVLVGHAIREKNTVYTLAGSVLLQYVACLAYALQASPTSPGFLAGLLQWNAVALGGYAWVWLGLQRWMQPVHPGDAASGEAFRAGDWAFAVQVAATHVVMIALAVWAAVSVFLSPGKLPAHCEPLGGVLSYVAWVLALGAGWPAAMKQGLEQRGRLVGAFALALVAFLAVTIDAHDASRMWDAYHVLTYGILAVAAGWTAAAWRWPQLGREAAVLCGLIAMLAVRGTAVDPSPLAPWWSVGAAAGAAALVTVLALARRSQALAYGSVLLAALATSIGVIGVYSSGPFRGAERVVADFIQANLIALAATGVFWLLVDLWYQRRHGSGGLDPSFRLPPVHVAAGILGLAVAALFFLGSLVINSVARSASSGNVLEATDLGGMLALGVLGTLLVGSLWEQRRGYGIPCLYVWGTLVIALVLDRLGIQGRLAFWAIGMAAGIYATLTSLIWRQGARLASVGSRWGICDPIAGLRRTAIWLPTVNLLVAAAATFATLIVVSFFPERWMRISSGMLPAALAIGLAALAQQERRTLLQFVSLLMTGVAAVCLSWADLQPDWSERLLLLRLIRVVIVLAGLTFVYGLIVVRRVPATSVWRAPVQRIAMTFGGGAGAALLAVLMLERFYYVPGVGAPVETAPMLAVAVVLVALVVGLISLALLPDRGQPSLTERQRQDLRVRRRGDRRADFCAPVHVPARLVCRRVPAVLALHRDGDRVCRRGGRRVVPAERHSRAVGSAAANGGLPAADSGVGILGGRRREVRLFGRPVCGGHGLLGVEHAPPLDGQRLGGAGRRQCGPVVVADGYRVCVLAASAVLADPARGFGPDRGAPQSPPSQAGSVGRVALRERVGHLPQFDQRDLPARRWRELVAAGDPGQSVRRRGLSGDHLPGAGVFVLGDQLRAVVRRHDGLARRAGHPARVAVVGVWDRAGDLHPGAVRLVREKAARNHRLGSAAAAVGEMRNRGFAKPKALASRDAKARRCCRLVSFEHPLVRPLMAMRCARMPACIGERAGATILPVGRTFIP